ncbi:MAG: hypothetical protein AABO58_12350 [Acidobacteriota bacterium]
MSRTSAVAFSLLLAAAVHAQTTPPPSGAFVPPIAGYAGRYLDSAQTPNFQGAPARTLRAQLVKVAPERGLILMKLSGSLFSVYNLSAFASRVGGALSTGGHGEKYLSPDVFSVDPEHSSEWTTFATDGQDFLFDFDYDDRGYFYLAYSAWGWGIVDSAGVKISQVVSPPVTPLRIIAVREGANVYAIISDPFSSATAVYDVTNPAAPVFLRTLPFGIASYAKLASGGVAIVLTTGVLRIYATGGDLAAGNLPAQTFAPQPGFVYTLAATDGITIFATQRSNAPLSAFLSVLTLSGGSYVETQYPPRPGFLPVDLHYGAGYVVVSGSTFPAPGTRTVLVYIAGSSTPSDLTAYFTAAYPSGPIGVESMAPYASGRQTYLIAALFGVGDVFIMSGAAAAAAIPALTPAMLLALAIGIAAIAAWHIR